MMSEDQNFLQEENPTDCGFLTNSPDLCDFMDICCDLDFDNLRVDDRRREECNTTMLEEDLLRCIPAENPTDADVVGDYLVDDPSREDRNTTLQRLSGRDFPDQCESPPSPGSLCRTENPTNDAIDDDIFDFPDDFKTYVKRKKLHCLRRNYGCDYVNLGFWSPEDDHCESTLDPFSEITEKIKSVLQKLEFLGQVLVQFWKPIEIGGRRLLTTRGQPFGLTIRKLRILPTISDLCLHRLAYLDYNFYVDGDCEEELGLISHVFQHQSLYYSQDFGCYGYREGQLLNYKVLYSHWPGSTALPVFESTGCCVGVLELVSGYASRPFTSKDIMFTTLEDVGLKAFKTCNHLYGQNKAKDDALEAALVEIRKGLEVVCGTHDLPLAQTWVLCRLCNAVFTSRNFNSRVNAEYGRGEYMHEFLDACSFHHLRNGQGVVGRAISSHNLVFCEDVTQFSKTEYPLVNYASKNKGCFAVGLRSDYTGDNLYVIEFFLPPRNAKVGDPRTICVSIFSIMRQHLPSFKAAFGEELGKDLPIEVIDFPKDDLEDDEFDSFQIIEPAGSPDRCKTLEHGGETERLDGEAIHTGNNAVSSPEQRNIASTSLQKHCIINTLHGQNRNSGIQISLENLKQHFGMKLDDAAESLGVSRSTLKRACRELQISRWPSHKKNKTNHSLSIKSVQGTAQEQIIDFSQPPISDPLRKQDMATAAGTEPHSMAVEDTGKVTIKAKHGDDWYRFQLPLSSGMVDFQKQVAERLNLEGGTYSVKYQDDDKDWIVIGCDEDLQNHISNSRSLGKNTVKMSLQPLAYCPPYMATALTKPHFMAVKDKSNVIIKAKYRNDWYKFPLPMSSGMVEFQQQVATRLKLEGGSYSVKYQDDDEDWIVIATDEDLQDYIRNSISQGRKEVKVSLQPITTNS